MRDWLADVFRPRPLWMNALMLFCLFLTFVYMPWDLFIKPIEVDEEIWFGLAFHGWGAKLSEPSGVTMTKRPSTKPAVLIGRMFG